MSGHFTLRQTNGCLILTPQGALCLELNESIRKDALAWLKKGGIRALIVDFTGIELIDSKEFEQLYQTMKMAALMGARPLIAGVHFGIASALVEMDFEVSDIIHTRSVDDALRMLI